jgi:hypothetical protein
VVAALAAGQPGDRQARVLADEDAHREDLPFGSTLTAVEQ